MSLVRLVTVTVICRPILCFADTPISAARLRASSTLHAQRVPHSRPTGTIPVATEVRAHRLMQAGN